MIQFSMLITIHCIMFHLLNFIQVSVLLDLVLANITGLEKVFSSILIESFSEFSIFMRLSSFHLWSELNYSFD